MSGLLSVGLFPKADKTEDFLGFLALAQVGIGIAKGLAVLVLRQKHQHARLAAAAGRDVVLLDDRILPVVRHRMEIEVEGRTVQ